jgi:hypothetical protein
MEAMRTNPARRRSPAMTAAALLLALVGLAFTGGCSAETPPQDGPASRTAPGTAAAPWLIVCSSLDDADETRLLLGLAADGRSVTRFELVTPDFLWHIPGQPETRRFAAGESDASPDLSHALRFAALADADGELRLLDFAAPEPDAVQLEGLRGSLALHESWQNDRALGSLFHAATGNLVDVAPVQCRRFAQPPARR